MVSGKRERMKGRMMRELISDFVVQTSLPYTLLRAYIYRGRQQERTVEISEEV